MKPDIHLLISDDAAHSNFGFIPGVKGPHARLFPTLEMLAAGGVVMDEWQFGSIVCSTSRAAMFTGRVPATWGMHTTAGTGRNIVDTIPSTVPTIFELAQSQGYDCALLGKNHTGRKYYEENVHTYGWAHPNPAYWPVGSSSALAAPINGTEPIMRDTLVGRENANFIGARNLLSPPILTVTAFDGPHHPCRPDAASLNAVGPSIKGPAALYFGSIIQLDTATKEIYDAAEALGRPYIIVFCSDNSGLDPTYTSILDQITVGGRYRGCKGEVGRGGTTGPAFVYGPAAGIPSGDLSSAYVSGLDIVPTLCSIWGVTPPADLDGEDASDAWFGRGWTRTKPLYWLSTQPQPATRPAYHDFPAFGGLFEGIGRVYCESDMSKFRVYGLDDPTELDAIELEQKDMVTVVSGLGGFISRCRAAGCPID